MLIHIIAFHASYFFYYYYVSLVWKFSPVLLAGALNSNNKLSSACKPAQALKILFKASFYLPKELTKGQSISVKGALHK